MRNEQIIITRRLLGQWAGFIGGFALLIGVLGVIWQGGITEYIIAIFVGGALGIGLWALLAPDEFTGFITGRQVRQGTMAVFATMLLIGIVVLVYIILERAVITQDMTEGHRFSLSQETQDVLARLRRETRIVGFYTPSDLTQREVDDQFFRLYEVATGGVISRQYIDPQEQPAIAQRFAQRFGLISYPYNVFLTFVNDDGSLDFDTSMAVPRTDTQERDMTESLARLMIVGQITVYFETGHGALTITDATSTGLSLIHNAIQANGVNTQPLDIQSLAESGGSIPALATAVILPRLTTPFSAEEIAVIDAYLKQGGALMILADPLFSETPFLAQNSAFNQYLWDHFGLRYMDAVVVDAISSSTTQLDIVSYQVFAENAISTGLNVEDQPDSVTLFRLARPIEVNDSPPVPNGRIIMTSSESYAETDLKSLRETNSYTYDLGADIPGPLTTAAWAQDDTTRARILMVGDGDFATNGQVSSPLGNATLFTDGLDWLTGASEQITFTPQSFITGLPVMFVDAATLDVIAFITVILLPGSILVAGIGVWLRRMRQ